jgi:hypothetical protein
MSDRFLSSEYPEEAAIVGRMLLGYGEIEYVVSLCLENAFADPQTAFRLMFRSRGESQRISIAETILQPLFIAQGLGKHFSETFRAISHCRTIRNQYAHCHLISKLLHTTDDFAFTSFEDAANANGGEIQFRLRLASKDLLGQQEQYFSLTMDALAYLNDQYQARAKKLPSRNLVMPALPERPPLHNPEA